MNNIMKIKLITYILIFFIPSVSFADYPNTSIGVIDINKILAESDAAVMASKQIEEIAIEIENEIKNSDEEIIKEQNLLIESQAIMAPEAFESKKNEYEIKVQNYNTERQFILLKKILTYLNTKRQSELIVVNTLDKYIIH